MPRSSISQARRCWFGTPADIAEAVCFLVSDATWLTGQAIYVDGGFLAAGLPLPAEM